MAKTNNDGAALLVVVAIAFFAWEWFKGKTPTVSKSSGCGCDGSPNNVTTVGSLTKSGSTVSRSSKARKSKPITGGNTPARVPGSGSVAGSGAQWSNVRRAASALTPAAAPSGPALTTGTSVWVANATPTALSN